LFWQTDEGHFAGTLESMHIGEASHLVLSSTSMAMVAWSTSACRFHSFFSVLPNLCFPHFQKRLHTVYDPKLNKGTCSMSATVFSLIICDASFALQIFFWKYLCPQYITVLLTETKQCVPLLDSSKVDLYDNKT
jgi:hypothetical protein